MADDVLNGDVNMLYVFDTETDTYKPVACLTSNGISKSREIRERKTKCNPGVIERSVGALSISLSAEGVLIDSTSVGGSTAKASGDWLDAKMDSGELLTLRNNVGTLAPKYYQAYLESLDISAPVDEDITFSATFTANGPGTTVDPNA